MKKILIITLFIFNFNLSAKDYDGYSGSGGMGDYHIKQNAYEYHYNNGFLGSDGAGWDPNLNYAWSRIAANIECDVIELSIKNVIKNLINEFGYDEITHEIVGIHFHRAQIFANKNFCTKDRISELKEVIPQFEKGIFPKKF